MVHETTEDMKLRSMDLIIEVVSKRTELISHTVAVSRGLVFLCSDIDVQTFLQRDCEVDTPSAHVLAVPNENGVNLYAKPWI